MNLLKRRLICNKWIIAVNLINIIFIGVVATHWWYMFLVVGLLIYTWYSTYKLFKFKRFHEYRFDGYVAEGDDVFNPNTKNVLFKFIAPYGTIIATDGRFMCFISKNANTNDDEIVFSDYVMPLNSAGREHFKTCIAGGVHDI